MRENKYLVLLQEGLLGELPTLVLQPVLDLGDFDVQLLRQPVNLRLFWVVLGLIPRFVKKWVKEGRTRRKDSRRVLSWALSSFR